MKHPIRRVLAAALTVAAMAGGTAFAKSWNLSAEQPDSNYHTKNIRLFAEDVQKATGNGLEFKIQSNGILLKRPEVKRGVQQGIVPIADVLMAAMANDDPIFEIDNIPFLAPSFDASERLWKLARPLIAERLDKQGLVLVYGTPWPPQGIYTKKPVQSLDDFKGAKLRAVNVAVARMATLMGAVPATVQVAEVPQAFSTNVIDMMMTSSATGVDTSAWDYTRFYYDVQASLPYSITIANKRALDGLTPEQRKAVMDAGARAETRGWAMAREQNASFVKVLSDKGIQVEQTPPRLAEQMKSIAQTMAEEWGKKADPQALEVLRAFRGQ